jgi:hypothetical protein
MNRVKAIQACEQWAGTSIGETLVSLTNVVFDAVPGNDLGYSYSSLAKALGIAKNDPRLFGTVAAATSPELHLLEPYYIFDDGEEEYHVSAEDVADAQVAEKFAHPRTGEIVEDYEAQLFVLFSISDEVRAAKAEIAR